MSELPPFTPSNPVDLLILGAGWTSTFLIPLCISKGITYAATSRSPDKSKSPYPTIPFEFDPLSDDPEPFTRLPDARTVLITFPIRVEGASERLVRLYEKTRSSGTSKGETGFIQLGSTGIWDGGPTLKDGSEEREHIWTDRHSPFDTTNARAKAESELLALSPSRPTTVLDLCGLWGGERDPRRFMLRVATSKEYLRNKGSIHMIHGEDVSRAILAVHSNFALASGQRWLLTDLRVYDWWDLVSAWSSSAPEEHPHARWVRELMGEMDVRGLPRSPERIGRAMDSREFWDTFGLDPVRGRM